MRQPMKSYYLRSIPPAVWDAFKRKAKAEGHSIREKILRLIEKDLGTDKP